MYDYDNLDGFFISQGESVAPVGGNNVHRELCHQ